MSKHPDDSVGNSAFRELAEFEASLSPQEKLETKAALSLIEAQRHADEGRIHYERVPGVPEPGGFRLPHHAIHALGGGNPRAAGKLLGELFGVHPDSPDVIPARVVHHIGGGDAKAGHRILKKFTSLLRGQRTRPRDVIEQPDNNHGRA